MALSTIDTSSISGLGYGFKNRIINGAMMIDQRNAGASVTPTSGQYLLDRYAASLSQASKFSVQQNAGAVTPPAGFTNYLGVTSLSAYSVVASDFFSIQQPIEGFNIADLGWGTATAQTITASFWVRSSLTGSFGGAVQNADFSRAYPFLYTISAANTWEYKTITIPGDTTGTWLTTTGVGLRFRFSLGMGSDRNATAGAWAAGNFLSATGATSVVGTNGATFYITGVQLEKGSTATSFDYRPYGTELNLCYRYYQNYLGGPTGFGYFGSGVYTSATNMRLYMPLIVPMRSNPSFGTSGPFWVVTGNALSDSVSSFAYDNGNTTGVALNCTVPSRAAGFGAVLLAAGSGSASLNFSSEL
jgi:hypothetical protein